MPTILIAEDEETILEVLTSILEDSGYQIRGAANGAAALAGLAAAPVDLVLSDVMMPIMDGRTVCHQMQADPRYQAIPVILMSAARAGLNLDACVHAAFLPKPFEVEELLETVAQVLRAAPRLAGRGPDD